MPKRPGVEEQVAEFCSGLRLSDVPPDVLASVKRFVIDYLGVAAGGRQYGLAVESLLVAAEHLAAEGGPCTVIGGGNGWRKEYAALLNGSFGHALDFDDTHGSAGVHPGAVVVPAALAAAEAEDATGEDLALALVAGYEVACRLGLAINARAHWGKGFHPTATCGLFAAVAAVGKIAKLDPPALLSAWGLALSVAGGTLQFLANGAWNKSVQVGWAAHNAIIAVDMSRAGVRGAAEPWIGRYGLFRAYSEGADPSAVLQGLADKWELLGTGLKPYPIPRFGHSAIDGLIDLAREYSLDPPSIAGIHVGLPQRGVDLLGSDNEWLKRPRTPLEAQFSLPFAAAVALARRRLRWQDLQDFADPELRALAERVSVTVGPRANAAYPPHLAAEVSVTTGTGQRYDGWVEVPLGEPANPLTDDQLREKFCDLASGVWTEERQRLLLEGCTRLEEHRSVRRLIRAVG